MSELPEIQGYEIIDEIGKGGMATVYKGIYNKLERIVAIKVLSPHFLHEENFAKRFLKEAKISAGLNHPNIITIFDVDNYKNYHYIVSEYFSGGTLKDMILSDKITPELALSIVKSIASALDYAHKKGFIHRDIKPDNIMFREDGTPVLVDFGIARALGSTTKLTKTGMSIGTPHYMSPEQARGKVLDGRSDIYSLGVVFYEMLTGKVPYEAEDSDSIAIAIKHIQEPIPDLWSEVRGQGLEGGEIKKYQNIINKMMAKNPEDRAQSGREVIELISKPSAFSLQLSADKNRIKTPEKHVGLNNNSPGEAIISDKGTYKKVDHINERDPIISGKEEKVFKSSFYNDKGLITEHIKKNKVLYLSLSLILLVIFTVWFATYSANKQEEKKLWQLADRQDTEYYYNKYIREYPSGRYIDKANYFKNKLEKKRLQELQEEKEKQLRQEAWEKTVKLKRKQERLKREEQQRKEQERLAAAKKRRERLAALRKQKEEETRKQAEAYSPGISLRSSYSTLSSNEAKSMIKRRGFFDLFDNPSGGFSNDFRVKTIRGDKVVINRATGLMWHQSGSSSYIKFSEAEEWIRDLNRRRYAGYSDWRLPTLEEAASLLEQTKRNGFYIDPVFSSKQEWIWTGDKYGSSRGWVVNFNHGRIYWSRYGYVRPVRRDN